jgi:hypothetical protein
MKKLLPILILLFTLQTPSQADDIRDFQIEGMSIGDSLLDYFSKEEIENKRKFYKLGGKLIKEFSKVYSNKNSKVYDAVVLYFKTDDKKYLITGISARKYYAYNIDECYDMQKSIVDEIDIIMSDAKKYDRKKKKLSYFQYSHSTDTEFMFKDNSFIAIRCYDYSKKDTDTQDRLTVLAMSGQLNYYLKSINK